MLMVFIPLLAVIFISVEGILKLNMTYDILTDSYYEKMYKVNALILNADRDMYQALTAQSNLEKANITEGDKTQNKQDLKDNTSQTSDRAKQAIEIIQPMKPILEKVKHDSANKNIFEIYSEFEQNYKAWLNTFNMETGEIKNKAEYTKMFQASRDDLNLMGEVMEKGGLETQTMMKSTIDSTEIQFLILSSIVIAITLIIGIIISRDSSKVLLKIRDLATRLSNYDFSQDLILNRRDEYGQTADTLTKAQQNIRELVNSIIENTNSIDSSSKEMALSVDKVHQNFNSVNEATKNISIGIQENSAISEEIYASVEEVNSSVSLLATKATEGTNNAVNIKERANTVGNSSKQASETIKMVYKEKEANIRKSIEDGKVVNEIGIMADSISEISEQINLLSLNAAIEAARAGEQGRGFAVVAEEVGKLADESSEAVKNVKGVIENVQKAFEDLSINSNELLKYMDEKVNKQFEDFAHIGIQYYDDADFVNAMSSELAAMSEEISATIDQVSDAVQHMTDMSQKSSESTEDIEKSLSYSVDFMNEISETAKEQSKLANSLSDLVKKFKV